MKLTSPEHTEGLQLIAGVRRASGSSAVVWLAFVASSAAASQPLPIAVELHPPIVSAEAPLELVVRSQSEERLEWQVYSKVRVRRRGVQGYQPDVYWAPLDLNGGRFYPANAMPWLRIDPGSILRVSFSLAKLRWALEPPSVLDHEWPHESFAAVVPPGEYDVWYEVGGLARSHQRPVASSPVRLAVR